jgi:hypothetical protein
MMRAADGKTWWHHGQPLRYFDEDIPAIKAPMSQLGALCPMSHTGGLCIQRDREGFVVHRRQRRRKQSAMAKPMGKALRLANHLIEWMAAPWCLHGCGIIYAA